LTLAEQRDALLPGSLSDKGFDFAVVSAQQLPLQSVSLTPIVRTPSVARDGRVPSRYSDRESDRARL